VSWDGPAIGVSSPQAVVAGDRVVVTGRLVARASTLRGDPVAGWLDADRLEIVGESGNPLFRTGNLLRRRVLDGLPDRAGRPEAALLAGFLIGEIGDVPDADLEALRRTGLAHFVAVSGSNVALFLTAWWLAAGPLGWGPRRRAVLGLVGLAVFVVATRWEPSVVRAAAMAGLVLGGRLAGVIVDGWAALGGAVTLLLLVSGELAFDVGFQLSVAATAGVLAGAGLGRSRRPRLVWQALAATASAQAAVAPLLLMHFGTVSLVAPIANLAAGPLVGLATILGGLGLATGVAPLTGLGLLAARGVLGLARSVRHLPQLGPAAVAAVGAGLTAAIRPGLRPVMALAGALALVGLVAHPIRPPSGPELRILDVGQGDAILLRSPDGAVVLVDGGPDPTVLQRKLFALGVRRIDLLVITHRHADHTGGLVGLGRVFEVRRVWHAGDAGLASVAAAGAVEEVEVGLRARVGWFDLEVLGPRRRYDSPNDGSVVLLVTASGRTALLAGDVEAAAQQDLGPVEVDVLKVPHQGAATSDPGWLAAISPLVAVISVGTNEFGHPDPGTVAVLESVGALVRRTDLEGDVVVRLDRL
jgi:competence protein ComEC